MKILGIIPALSEDKVVPNKNMRKVNDQTLLSRAMYSAYPCSAVAIASDSNNILTYAGVFEERLEKYPPLYFIKLPKPSMNTEEIISHVISDVSQFDAYIILDPANPLREQRDVRSSIAIMVRSSCDSVVSVSPCSNKLGELEASNDNMGMRFYPQPEMNIPMAYENGAIYLFSNFHWVDSKSKMGGNMKAYIMDEPMGINIKYEKDLVQADAYLRGMGK